MKKRILVFAVIVMAIMCLFAISISAAETKTVDGITYYLYQNNSNYYCEATNANKSCSLETVIIPKTITGSDGNEYTFIQVNKEAFKGNKTIKYVSLPATVTKLGQSAFEGCTSLQYIDFNDNQNNVVFDNCTVFSGCTALKAFCFPDNTTTITNRIFLNCTSLEAVYLPSNLVTLETNGYNQGAFSGAKEMYFVKEQFDVCDENGAFYGDSFAMPEKPSVYFMPSTLENLFNRSSGTGFFENDALNDVIVVGENVTTIKPNDGLMTECGSKDSPKTVVFLGDITDFYFSSQNTRANYLTFVFANAKDTDASCVNIVNNNSNSITEGYLYFCAGGCYYNMPKKGATLEKLTGTNHVTNPNLTQVTDATCEENRGERTYCFCGAEIGFSPVEGTALGHEHNVEKGATKVNVAYTGEKGYLGTGVLSIKCARCENVKETDVNPIISEFKGFSTPEEGDGLTFGYLIDYEALNEYVKVTGNDVELGIVFGSKALLGDKAPLKGNGEANDKVTKVDVVNWTTDDTANETAIKYTGVDFIVTGDWTDLKDIEIYMAGYLTYGNATDGYKYVYLNAGSSSDTADYTTYNTIVNGGNPPATDDSTVTE